MSQIIVENFLNEQFIKFKDLGNIYFESGDKFYKVFQITFCNNNGFQELHNFISNYSAKSTYNHMELIYKSELLYIKFL